MKTSKKIPVSRREILALMGVGGTLPLQGNPLRALFTAMVDGLIAKAQAAPAGITNPKNFVAFVLPGGAESYVGGSPLRIRSSDPFIAPATHTAFLNNGASPTYATTPVSHNGVTWQLPNLFSSTIRDATGASLPLSQFAAEWLGLRGVSGIDNHDTSRKFMLQGRQGYSIMGKVADADFHAMNSTPMTAISMGDTTEATRSFVADQAGLTIANFNGNNTYNTILAPFAQTNLNTTLVQRRLAMAALIEEAQGRIESWALSNNPGAEKLSTMRRNANRLFERAAQNLQGQWDSTVARYRTVISMHNGQNGDSGVANVYGPGVTINNPNDGRTQNGGTPITTANLGQLIGPNTTVGNLAEDFALVEFILKENLSRVVAVEVGGVNNLVNGGGTFGMGVDAHGVGSFIRNIADTFKWRCIYACVNELKRNIGSDIWNNTVILTTSEFSRSPRNNGTGADHGFRSCYGNVMGGGIQFNVAGSLQARSNDDDRAGTWQGYDLDDLGTEFDYVAFVNTLATLCRVDPVVAGFAPVTNEQGVPNFEPRTLNNV